MSPVSDSGDRRLFDDAVHRGAHEQRLIEQEVEVIVRRQSREDLRHRPAHARYDVEGRAATRLQDADEVRRGDRWCERS